MQRHVETRGYILASVYRTVHVYVHASVSVAGAKHPRISIAPYTPRALVFALRSETSPMQPRCSSLVPASNTVPANFLRRRTRPPAFLPCLPFLSPSSYRPLSSQREKKQAKIRCQRFQEGEDRNDWEDPIPSILFRFPGETKGKRTGRLLQGNAFRA